mmetsp:Transcript_58126/g.138310  ORF Transcript_58126/g.138310 Transcript_58126/m.138310 type:complete len:493 (-) Transcript_58126:69-1547(-)
MSVPCCWRLLSVTVLVLQSEILRSGALHVSSEQHVVAAQGEVATLETSVLSKSSLAAVLLAEPGHHPWSQLDWSYVSDSPRSVLICCLVLLASGVLCAAGGIGGGGIYVSLLMMVGGLSAHDAVPLSKAIVFIGALVTLLQNLASRQTRGQPMIDYNACSLIVPSALSGTLLGVFINRLVVEWVLVVLIVFVLVLMSIATAREVYKQYLQSTCEPNQPPSLQAESLASQTQKICAPGVSGCRQVRHEISPQETAIALLLLAFVVCCGAIHYRLSECQRSLRHGMVEEHAENDACNHPLLVVVAFQNRPVREWMSDELRSEVALVLSMIAPLALCSTVAVWSSWSCRRNYEWSGADVMLYSGTATATGLLAGLVGIGGGLIFSPFLLLMGMQPCMAVATSSTCVMFTSCSTALQYMLSDRVVMSLCLVYGGVNVLASYLGTMYVHYLQGRPKAHKSQWRISLAVFAGVAISILFCLAKCRLLLARHSQIVAQH